MRTVLTAQMKDVFEARRADERRSRAAPLEERVRGDRRPVREAFDRLRADRPRGCEHRFLLTFCREHLRCSNLAVRDEHGVGEGAADVDPERTHRRMVTVTEVAVTRFSSSVESLSWTVSSASGSAIAPHPWSFASAWARWVSGRSAVPVSTSTLL